jgi:hypothetical protein
VSEDKIVRKGKEEGRGGFEAGMLEFEDADR